LRKGLQVRLFRSSHWFITGDPMIGIFRHVAVVRGLLRAFVG
jgi:hypothetical protein